MFCIIPSSTFARKTALYQRYAPKIISSIPIISDGIFSVGIIPAATKSCCPRITAAIVTAMLIRRKLDLCHTSGDGLYLS
ncbi:MAG: hypothetical protein IJ305_01225 [Oscillospiraceae bacterium]|nr:hypothetical protein [Oscillospiraceae bacterium]